MFIVPKSLIGAWSDYQSAAQDTALFLESYLDGIAELATLPVDLKQISEEGIQSAETATIVSRALEKLRASCVSGGRYYHNVEVRQSIGFENMDLACTPRIPGSQSLRVRDALPWTSRRFSGDAVIVIDAPLFVSEFDVYLSDFPPCVARPADVRLRLELSPEMLLEVTKFCRENHYPFCRTVGIYTEQGGRPRLKVLEFRLRAPRGEPRNWPLELMEEASAAAFGPGGAVKLWEESVLRAFDRISEDLGKETPLSDSDFTEKHGPELMRYLSVDEAADAFRQVIHFENTIYEGDGRILGRSRHAAIWLA